MANKQRKLLFRLCRKVCYAGNRSVHVRTAELFLRHVFARHGFHHLRPRQEHITNALQHHNEVSQSRRIHSTTGARAANTGDLWDYTAGFNVALKDFAKTGQRIDAFLNACTARIVKADAGSARLHSKVHHLAYLFGHRDRETTTVDRKILRENEDQAAIDRTGAGHNAIAQILLLIHAKVVAAMKLKHIHFLEGTFIQQ